LEREEYFGEAEGTRSIDVPGTGTCVAQLLHFLVPEAKIFLAQLDIKSREGDVAAAIDRAVEKKAGVIFIATAYRFAPQDDEDEDEISNACERAHARGVVIVAPAGNNGRSSSDRCVQSPANFPSVIGVGVCDEKGDLLPSCARGLPGKPDDVSKPDVVLHLPDLRALIGHHCTDDMVAAVVVTGFVARCSSNQNPLEVKQHLLSMSPIERRKDVLELCNYFERKFPLEPSSTFVSLLSEYESTSIPESSLAMMLLNQGPSCVDEPNFVLDLSSHGRRAKSRSKGNRTDHKSRDHSRSPQRISSVIRLKDSDVAAVVDEDVDGDDEHHPEAQLSASSRKTKV
jgi:hypothetical protein